MIVDPLFGGASSQEETASDAARPADSTSPDAAASASVAFGTLGSTRRGSTA
jgi:hypothetical protein